MGWEFAEATKKIEEHDRQWWAEQNSRDNYVMNNQEGSKSHQCAHGGENKAIGFADTWIFAGFDGLGEVAKLFGYLFMIRQRMKCRGDGDKDEAKERWIKVKSWVDILELFAWVAECIMLSMVTPFDYDWVGFIYVSVGMLTVNSLLLHRHAILKREELAQKWFREFWTMSVMESSTDMIKNIIRMYLADALPCLFYENYRLNQVFAIQTAIFTIPWLLSYFAIFYGKDGC